MIKLSVSIDVDNLEKAQSFYINALGCKKLRNQGDMVVLKVRNCDIYLQQKAEGSNPLILTKATRNYKRHWTPVHLDFLTKDIDNIVKKVVEFGGIHEGGDSGEWGSIAYCSDPFGNGFCVIDE